MTPEERLGASPSGSGSRKSKPTVSTADAASIPCAKAGIVLGVPMTMVEAFQELERLRDVHVWVRPSAWRGHYAAFWIDWRVPNRIMLGPSARGGVPATMPGLSVMLGTWELVDPHEVNEGR